MLDWVIIVICVLFLGLVGCRGVDRLTGTEKKEVQKVTIVNHTDSPILMEFGGIFTNDNFVELQKVPKEKYDDIYVDIIRKGEVNQVQSYSKKRDEEGHPYYMVSESGGLVFFNIQYGDEYQIFIYK